MCSSTHFYVLFLPFFPSNFCSSVSFMSIFHISLQTPARKPEVCWFDNFLLDAFNIIYCLFSEDTTKLFFFLELVLESIWTVSKLTITYTIMKHKQELKSFFWFYWISDAFTGGVFFYTYILSLLIAFFQSFVWMYSMKWGGL